MREIKLRMQVLQGVSRERHAEPCHWSEGCNNNGVTAGKASHNASNARGVTAGKMGRNSSNTKDLTRHKRSQQITAKDNRTHGHNIFC